MIKKLEHQSYNFIINLKDDIYQCIFIRNSEKVVPNLNFGSTELAGIIGSNKDDFKNTKDDIEKYLEETNNISNYNFMDKGAIKKRRNKKEKSKGKSKRKSKKDQNKNEKIKRKNLKRKT